GLFPDPPDQSPYLPGPELNLDGKEGTAVIRPSMGDDGQEGMEAPLHPFPIPFHIPGKLPEKPIHQLLPGNRSGGGGPAEKVKPRVGTEAFPQLPSPQFLPEPQLHLSPDVVLRVFLRPG